LSGLGVFFADEFCEGSQRVTPVVEGLVFVRLDLDGFLIPLKGLPKRVLSGLWVSLADESCERYQVVAPVVQRLVLVRLDVDGFLILFKGLLE